MKAFLYRYKKQIVSLLWFLLFGVVIALIVKYSQVFAFLNEQWINTYITNQGFRGAGFLVAVLALGSAVSLPRQVSAFVSGYAFGALYGTLLATTAVIIGCTITFFSARYLAQPFIKRRYPDKISTINSFLQHNTFTKTIIIRLVPAGNNFMLNGVAGVGQINAKTFILASYIGYFPQMIIFSLLGSGIEDFSGWQIGCSVALMVIAAALSYRLLKQHRIPLKGAKTKSTD